MDGSSISTWLTRPVLAVPSTWVVGLGSCFVLYAVTMAIYNIYFHPLSHIPGPKSYAASQLRNVWTTMNGNLPFDLHKMHEKYGPVVRYSPIHVSFSDGRAYRELYSNKSGRGQLIKDPPIYDQTKIDDTHNIVSTPSDADHSRFRRLLSPGFSERAIREQEQVVSHYVDLLIQGLRDRSSTPQDMVAWYNWTTFDLIGDLTFDESFQCLKESAYHPWIKFIFGSLKIATCLGALQAFPMIYTPITTLLSKRIEQSRESNASFTRQKVANRLASKTERLDFLSYAIRERGASGMTKAEITATSSLIVLGGSETTATVLAGVTYLLLKHPEILKRLVDEVRSKFTKEEEISITSVNTLAFELAVLEEAMRLLPPVPMGSFRRLGPQGESFLGYYLPPFTRVIASNYPCCHSSRNWKDPHSFRPERWMDDPLYKDDQRVASQPFSSGPRNCIGRNLAYAEMRLILARMIWNFDMELTEGSKTWMEKLKVWSLWEKEPLFVKLVPVVR